MTIQILNNKLPWDATYLLSNDEVEIKNQWCMEGTIYQEIRFPPGWKSPDETFSVDYGGVIYCIAVYMKDLFPCIVEGIKNIFGLQNRGIHRITIKHKEYIIYYVPISEKGEIIWETPLNRLDNKHFLRYNCEFKTAVQKTIAFCDILALSSTGEPQIRIRPGCEGNFFPVIFNENSTTIIKCVDYDYSILNKTLFSKWFGEDTDINDIVKDMVQYKIGNRNKNLAVLTSDIRNKVDNVIRKYDNSYIWYSNFIIDRLSRHLLVD